MSEIKHSTLGLPTGSIRAILALVVFGVSMTLLILKRPVDQSLWLATILVLGYYFASRGAADDDVRPLGLPRGSVRWIMLLGFALTATLIGLRWHRESVDPTTQPAFFPLMAIASFFLGRAFRALSRGRFARSGGTLSGLFADAQAVVALVSAAALVALFLFELDFEGATRIKEGTLSFLLFYFGSR